MDCPCGSGGAFDACCGPFLDGAALPDTAERLMRARYSAFATARIDFLNDTIDPENRDEFDTDSAKVWAESSEWLGFELISTENGGPEDDEGTVEFVARYRLEGNDREHHEVASFARIDDRWYFMDGTVTGQQTFRRDSAKVGRNDPCPCGSGKKHKKCCGRPGADS